MAVTIMTSCRCSELLLLSHRLFFFKKTTQNQSDCRVFSGLVAYTHAHAHGRTRQAERRGRQAERRSCTAHHKSFYISTFFHPRPPPPPPFNFSSTVLCVCSKGYLYTPPRGAGGYRSSIGDHLSNTFLFPEESEHFAETADSKMNMLRGDE